MEALKKKVHLNSLNHRYHRYFLSRHLTKALASECQLPLMALPWIKLSIEEVHFRYWSEVHLSNISGQKILLEIFQKQDDSWDFSVSLNVSVEKKMWHELVSAKTKKSVAGRIINPHASKSITFLQNFKCKDYFVSI